AAAADLDGCYVFAPSFGQERLWFLSQLEPSSNAAYHLPLAARLEGDLDVVALQQAVDELVARHEALRTRICVVDGGPVQAIAPALSLAVPIVDLRAGEDPDAAIRRETGRLFDLARGPLARFCLLRLGPTRHILVLTVHHIVAD